MSMLFMEAIYYLFVAGIVFDRDFLNGYNKIEYNCCYTDAAYTIEGRASV